MLNINYLKYLFNSKKYLLLFIVVLMALTIITMKEIVACGFIFAIACILAYVIPIDIFSYMHNKKAVDSYYSLPIKRRELLFTGICFSIIIVMTVFVLGYSTIEIINHKFTVNTLLDMAVVVVGFISLISFNTLLYQIGNSVLDGTIMIGAYSILPFVLNTLISFYYDKFVYGFEIVNSYFENYLSPFYMTLINFMNIRDGVQGYHFGYIIALAIITVLSLLVINHFFEKRKVERAETSSKSFFAYPLITTLYTSVCLMALAFCYNSSYTSFIEYLKDNSILIVIVFILYVVSHFIYKRSFYFDYKLPIIFILIFGLCLGFSVVSRNTHGFGIAYNYNKQNINRCDIYIDEIDTKLKKDLDMNDEYLYIDITLGEENYQEALDNEVLKMIDERRLEAIKSFYAGEKRNYGQTINVYNNYNINSVGFYSFTDNYVYSSKCNFTYDDLLKVASIENCKVVIYGDKGSYKLMPDGELFSTEK